MQSSNTTQSHTGNVCWQSQSAMATVVCFTKRRPHFKAAQGTYKTNKGWTWKLEEHAYKLLTNSIDLNRKMPSMAITATYLWAAGCLCMHPWQLRAFHTCQVCQPWENGRDCLQADIYAHKNPHIRCVCVWFVCCVSNFAADIGSCLMLPIMQQITVPCILAPKRQNI